MIGTKILTVMFGFLLLLPLAWSFGVMLFRDYQTPKVEARRRYEEVAQEMSKQSSTRSSRTTMFWAMRIPDLDSIHLSMTRFWLFSPRRWVGLIGLGCCVLVFSLWTWCALSYVDITPKLPEPAGFMADDGPAPEVVALPFYPTADARLNELIESIMDIDDVDKAVLSAKDLEREARPEWRDPLYQALQVKDEFFLRECVAPAVVRLDGVRSLPRLLAALSLGTAEGHDNDSLVGIIWDLTDGNKSEVAEILLLMATSADAGERESAAWLLGSVHDQVQPEVLIQLAADPVVDVRTSAFGSLSSFKGNEAVFECLVRGLEDPAPPVVKAAAGAMGYFGDPRALPLLKKLKMRLPEQSHSIIEQSIKSLEEPSSK
jgi:hypothetical protein